MADIAIETSKSATQTPLKSTVYTFTSESVSEGHPDKSLRLHCRFDPGRLHRARPTFASCV